jgi:hypothetical protein
MFEVIKTLPEDDEEGVEKNVRNALSNLIRGTCEVKNKYGVADIVTKKLLIEVKSAHLWKHALGQVLAYSKAMPKLRPCIHLFGEVEKIRQYVPRARKCCSLYGVFLTSSVVDETVEFEDQVEIAARKLKKLSSKWRKAQKERKLQLKCDMQDILHIKNSLCSTE